MEFFGDPTSLGEAYAQRVQELGIPDYQSKVDLALERMLKFRRLWIASLFDTWALSLDQVRSFEGDESFGANRLEQLGMDILSIKKDVIFEGLDFHQRHAIAVTYIGKCQMLPFEQWMDIATAVAQNLGVDYDIRAATEEAEASSVPIGHQHGDHAVASATAN